MQLKLGPDPSNNYPYSFRNLFQNSYSCSKYNSMSSIQRCDKIFRIQDHFFKSFHITVSCHTCQFSSTISMEDWFRNLFEKILFFSVLYYKECIKSLFREFTCGLLCKRLKGLFLLATKMKMSHQFSQLFSY